MEKFDKIIHELLRDLIGTAKENEDTDSIVEKIEFIIKERVNKEIYYANMEKRNKRVWVSYKRLPQQQIYYFETMDEAMEFIKMVEEMDFRREITYKIEDFEIDNIDKAYKNIVETMEYIDEMR